MSAYVYPTRDIERPQRLAELCGSVWGGGGDATVTGFLGGFGRLIRQSDQNLLEARQVTGRFTTPLRHRDLWRYLTFLESELLEGDASLPHYGEGYVYGSEDTPTFYGMPVSRNSFWLPLPPHVVAIAAMHNRLSDPTVTWLEGVDYQTDPVYGVVKFLHNPFINTLLPIRNVYEGNEVVDRELIMWGQNVDADDNLVHEHHGYVLQLPGPAKDSYKRMVNAVWDYAVLGSSHNCVREILGAVADVPIVTNEEEIVEAVWTQSDATVIVTDLKTYRAGPDAVASVAAGDVIRRGDFLTTAVRLNELNTRQLPEDLLWLAVEPRFLPAGFHGSLVFDNAAVPLEIDDSGDDVEVRFAIGGAPEDVELFWDAVHAAGVAADSTLAELLDSRTNPTGPPSAAYLPATINPAQFLVDNIFRNNLFLVRLDSSQFGVDQLPLSRLSRLREALPPHVGVLIQISSTMPAGSFDLTTITGDGDAAGVSTYAIPLSLPDMVSGDGGLQYAGELCT